MWPLGSILPDLPPHLRLTLTAKYVELRCERCGWWEAFNRDKVTREQIVEAAQAHRCPYCGADNPLLSE
jgi:predicted nucleic-acid-binding Zn-ribbon protein